MSVPHSNCISFKLTRCNQKNLFRQRLQRAIPELKDISETDDAYADICNGYNGVAHYYANSIITNVGNMFIIPVHILREIWYKTGRAILKSDTSLFIFLLKVIPGEEYKSPTTQIKKLAKTTVFRQMMYRFLTGVSIFSDNIMTGSQRRHVLSVDIEKLTTNLLKKCINSDILFYYIVAEFVITQTTYDMILYNILKTTDVWRSFKSHIGSGVNRIRRVVLCSLVDILTTEKFRITQFKRAFHAKSRSDTDTVSPIEYFEWAPPRLNAHLVYKKICVKLRLAKDVPPNVLGLVGRAVRDIDEFSKTSDKIPYHIFLRAGFTDMDIFEGAVLYANSLMAFLTTTTEKNIAIIYVWAHCVRKYQTLQVVSYNIPTKMSQSMCICNVRWHPCIRQPSKRKTKREKQEDKKIKLMGKSAMKRKSPDDEPNVSVAPQYYHPIHINIVTKDKWCSKCMADDMTLVNLYTHRLVYGRNTICICRTCNKIQFKTTGGIFYSNTVYECGACFRKKLTEKKRCYRHLCDNDTVVSFLALSESRKRKTYHACKFHGRVIPDDIETCILGILGANN